MKSTACALSALLILTACNTAPTAPPTAVPACPRIPALEPVSPDALAPSFGDRMRAFLSGKLPEPTPFDYTLPPAKLSTTP